MSGYLEAELVHGVDLIEIVHDEVQQRSSNGNRTIVFSSFIYLHFINFCFQNLTMRDDKNRKQEKI